MGRTCVRKALFPVPDVPTTRIFRLMQQQRSSGVAAAAGLEPQAPIDSDLARFSRAPYLLQIGRWLARSRREHDCDCTTINSVLVLVFVFIVAQVCESGVLVLACVPRLSRARYRLVLQSEAALRSSTG